MDYLLLSLFFNAREYVEGYVPVLFSSRGSGRQRLQALPHTCKTAGAGEEVDSDPTVPTEPLGF